MIQLPPLPYAENALEPIISAQTLRFHYGKHHQAYVKKTNELLEHSGWAEESLVPLLRKIAGDPGQKKLFNNAAQVWNHNFYWQCLKPGGSHPTGEMRDLIDASFDNLEGLKKKWIAAAMGQFGSGWVWLCREGDHLTLQAMPNAETPVATNKSTPLLTIDVWEHAYYLDYQNRRQDHVAALIDDLLNWDFAAANNSGDRERISSK